MLSGETLAEFTDFRVQRSAVCPSNWLVTARNASGFRPILGKFYRKVDAEEHRRQLMIRKAHWLEQQRRSM